MLLVDVAAREKDPLRRIAFVAAFAMSNYSSTIGRIAKPFNPMLVRVVIHPNFQSLQRLLCDCRAKPSNMSGWTDSIDTSRSKLATILPFRRAGRSHLRGITTARLVIPLASRPQHKT